MASLFTIEKRTPGGAWESHTYAPNADRKKVADGLPACVGSNPEKEWRVAEYVRVEPSWSFEVESDNRWFHVLTIRDEAQVAETTANVRGSFHSMRVRVTEFPTRTSTIHERKRP